MAEKKKEKEFRFFWEDTDDKNTKDYDNMSSLAVPKSLEIRNIPINVAETDKDMIIRLELHGFKKDEISLNVTDNFMEIIAQKKEEKTEKTESMLRHERSLGSLRRAFTLPKLVDAEGAEARLENGTLTVVIPKLYAAKKKKRKVEIK